MKTSFLILILIWSCSEIVKSKSEKIQFKSDTISKENVSSSQSATLTSKISELDMDKVLANLERKPDPQALKYKEWLESVVINNFNSENNYPMLTKEVQELWRNMKDLEYDSERNFTKALFDEKWQSKVDYKYLGWYQYFYDGQDGPDQVKVDAELIGNFNESYFYKITVSDIEGDKIWPKQNGKIFKVESVDNKPIISGIYLKGESVVWDDLSK